MVRLVVGTTNIGKLLEIREFLKGLPLEVVSLAEIKNPPEIRETGNTFHENAIKKAEVIAKKTGSVALADDSGILVPALRGEPGVHSARYAGENATDQDNIQKLLQNAKNLTGDKRKAYFQCVIVVAKPSGEKLVVEGRVDGSLLHAPRGNRGFGYDPIFFLHELNKSMAELPMEEKSKISHRGKAMSALVDKLPEFLQLH